MGTLFEHYMIEDHLLEEERVLFEGRFMDFIKKIGSKFHGKLVKDKLEQALPQVSPRQQQMVKTAIHMLPLDDIVLDIPHNIDDDIQQRNLLNDLNRRLIDVFGDWWKDHLITQDDFQQSVQQFQQEHGNVAMPVR